MNSELVGRYDGRCNTNRGVPLSADAATDEVMALVTIKPTKPDVLIAREVTRNTSRRAERVSRGLTWGADEKILLALASAGWVATRGRSEQLQRVGNHALLVTVAASLLPHSLNSVFDQTRPDRFTVLDHLHDVSFSGKRKDAFPSGPALHMGALASAAGTLPPLPRRAIRTVAIGLCLTRIVVLAHWASDVVAGFALGVVMERLLRLWTGYRLQSSEESDANP
jgi:undecaprenyl-diphosphatase